MLPFQPFQQRPCRSRHQTGEAPHDQMCFSPVVDPLRPHQFLFWRRRRQTHHSPRKVRTKQLPAVAACPQKCLSAPENKPLLVYSYARSTCVLMRHHLGDILHVVSCLRQNSSDKCLLPTFYLLFVFDFDKRLPIKPNINCLSQREHLVLARC